MSGDRTTAGTDLDDLDDDGASQDVAVRLAELFEKARQSQDGQDEGDPVKIKTIEVAGQQVPSKLTYSDRVAVDLAYRSDGVIDTLTLNRPGKPPVKFIYDGTDENGKAIYKSEGSASITSSIQVDGKNVTIKASSAGGELVTKFNDDGSEEIRFEASDHTKWLIRTDGNVTAEDLTFPDGSRQTHAYDKDGKLTSLQEFASGQSEPSVEYRKVRGPAMDADVWERIDKKTGETSYLAGVFTKDLSGREVFTNMGEAAPPVVRAKADVPAGPAQPAYKAKDQDKDATVGDKPSPGKDQLPAAKGVGDKRDVPLLAFSRLEKFGDKELPVAHKSADGLQLQVARNATTGKIESITLTPVGKPAVTFKVKEDGSVEGRDGMTVKDGDDGKIAIETKAGGITLKVDFLKDGTRVNSEEKPDNSSTITHTFPDKTVSRQEFDSNGSHTRILVREQGKPDAEYKRIGAFGNEFEKYVNGEKVATGNLTIGDNGRVSFEVKEQHKPEDKPKELAEAQQRQRNKELQTILQTAWPATLNEQMATESQKLAKEYADKRSNPNLNKAERDAVEREFEQKARELQQKYEKQAREVTDAIKKEQEKGEFGPATQKAYKEYVQWLQEKGIPGATQLSAKMGIFAPPDNPMLLPPDAARGGAPMNPSEYMRLLSEGKAPPLDLGLATDKAPSYDDMKVLGESIAWMLKTDDAINKARQHYEINNTFPDIIKHNHLPEGWRFKDGQDADSYRDAFRRASQAALRTQNLLKAINDTGMIPKLKGLELPPGVQIEYDSGGKIKSLKLDLPDTLNGSPESEGKIRRLEQWLDTHGKELQDKIDEVVQKMEDPAKFLYWGEVEVPGYKVKDKDGVEHEVNLLQSRYDVKTRPDGKIEVNYTMAPSNASWYSYQNLIGVSEVEGAKHTETRVYDPEEYVAVRHGMEKVELVKAKDLAGWKAQRQLMHYGEKGLVITMDAAMVATGTIEMRAAWTASELTARQFAYQMIKGSFRVGLGASGIFNNAKIKESEAGRAFLLGRGLVFVGETALGLPGQVGELVGPAKAAHSWWSTISGGAKVHEQLQKFNWVAREGVPGVMMLSNLGFAPIIGHDIMHQFNKTDLRRSTQPFLNAERMTRSGNRIEDPTDREVAVLKNYGAKLGTSPESKAEVEKVLAIAQDLAALNKTDRDATRQAERLAKAKQDLLAYLRPADGVKVDPDAQVMAAAALMMINRKADGSLPPGGVLATRQVDGRTENVTVQDVVDMLQKPLEGASPVARFAAAELLVRSGAMPEHVYGQMLRQAEASGSPAEKAWSKERSEYVEKALSERLRQQQGSEQELAVRLMESYEKRFANAPPETREKIKDLVKETKELMELKEKNLAEFQRRFAEFQEKYAPLFRSSGAEISALEQQASDRNEKTVTLTDEEMRKREVSAGGPLALDERKRAKTDSPVDKDLQVTAAAAFMLLSRDKDGKFPPDGVLGKRTVDVPAFTWTEVVSSGESTTTITHDVPARKQEQQIKLNDVIALLRQDVENPASGSRRLVSGDMLVNSGAMSAQTFSSLLIDTLNPKDGRAVPAEEKQWALERLAYIANATRVVEAYQDLNLSREARAAARGKHFGTAYADMVSALEKTATTDGDLDMRARAAAVLRALRENPDNAQSRIGASIEDWRKERPAGEFHKDFVEKMQSDLKSSNPESRMSAAMALSQLGQIDDKDFNKVLVGVIDEKTNAALTAEAIKRLKLSGRADDLSPEDRKKVTDLLATRLVRENREVKLAVIEKLPLLLPNSAGDPLVKEAKENLARLFTPASRLPDALKVPMEIYAREFPQIREAAVKALAHLDGNRAAALILNAANPKFEENASVRLAAVDALARVHAPLVRENIDQFIRSETSPAVRARLEDLKFQVQRPPEGPEFERLAREAMDRTRANQAPSGALKSSSEVQAYLDGRAQRSFTLGGARYENRSILIGGNLDDYAKSRWENEGKGRFTDGLSRIGNWFGAGVERGPDQQVRIFTEVNDEGKREVQSLITDAKNGDIKAISAIAYLAKDASTIHGNFKAQAQEDFAKALIEMCGPESKNRTAALWALRENLAHGTDARMKDLFLQGLTKAMEKPAAIEPADAMALLSTALEREAQQSQNLLARDKNDPERKASIEYQTKLLQMMETLDYRGNLPNLDAIIKAHPAAEIVAEAQRLHAKLSQSVEPLIASATDSSKPAADRAKGLEQALTATNRTSDTVAREIFSSVKNSPIKDAQDPRIALLERALADKDPKVKMAAAMVLMDKQNDGLSDASRRKAAEALGQLKAYAEKFQQQGILQDVQKVTDMMKEHNKAGFTQTMEQSFTRAKEQLQLGLPANLKELPSRRLQDGRTVFDQVQPNGSVFAFDENGRIAQLLYPRKPGDAFPRSSTILRDAAGAVTDVIGPDGRKLPKNGLTVGQDGTISYIKDGKRHTVTGDGKFHYAELPKDSAPVQPARPEGPQLQIQRPAESEAYRKAAQDAFDKIVTNQAPSGVPKNSAEINAYLAGRDQRSFHLNGAHYANRSILLGGNLDDYAKARWASEGKGAFSDGLARIGNWFGSGAERSQEQQNRIFAEVNEEGKNAVLSLIRDAKENGDAKAIAAIAHLAKDASAIHGNFREWAQQEFANALVEMCAPGSTNRQAALWALRENMGHGNDAKTKELFLKGLEKAIQVGPGERVPFLRAEEAAAILSQALEREIGQSRNLMSRAENDPERRASIEYQKKILQMMEKLDYRGYLPNLEGLMRAHPIPEIQREAQRINAKFSQSVEPLLAAARNDEKVTPADKAKNLEQALTAGNRYADDVVKEIFASTKGGDGAKIKEAGDPRTPQLEKALTDGDPKVRMAAALVLLDKVNTGVSEATRKKAAESLAQTKAYAERYNLEGLVSDAWRANELVRAHQNEDLSKHFEAAYERARQQQALAPAKLLDLPGRTMDDGRTAYDNVHPDGSMVSYDEQGRVLQIKYPKELGKAEQTVVNVKRDDDGAITEIIGPDGKALPKDGLVVLPDGSIKYKEGNRTHTIHPDGKRSSIDTDSAGNVVRIAYGDGTAVTLKYENGKLTEFNGWQRVPGTNQFRKGEEIRVVEAGQPGPDGTLTFQDTKTRRVTWYPNGREQLTYRKEV